MSVFPDPHDDERGLRFPKKFGVTGTFGVGVRRFPVQLVERGHGHMVQQTLAQEAAERRGVIAAHAGVLVHMEGRDLVPGNLRLQPKRGKKGVLGNGRGEHDRHAAIAGNRRTDQVRGNLRARYARASRVTANLHFQKIDRHNLSSKPQPAVPVARHEFIVHQVRVLFADPVDLLDLTRRKILFRIETPASGEKTLTAQNLM